MLGSTRWRHQPIWRLVRACFLVHRLPSSETETDRETWLVSHVTFHIFHIFCFKDDKQGSEKLWVSPNLTIDVRPADLKPALSVMQETWVCSLGQEDPLEEKMATHFSILAWKIPRTEEPGGLQSMGSQRVGHDRSDHIHPSFLASSGIVKSWLGTMEILGCGGHLPHYRVLSRVSNPAQEMPP